MAVELATAYISIVPETSKIAPGVRKALGGVESDATGRGKSLGGKLAAGMGTALKAGAVGAGAAVAGVFGTALAKGFGRLTAIEQAEAKLRGLGHSAGTVQTIMDDALASVKGTAFGLGEAASAAASAVASGIKPGEDLQRNLKLVGDAAAIAGTDFGQMAAIFNKVSASGVIQGEELAQLGDRGIPILQLLGEELGVSAQEVRKLASEGKVSFADFQNAMEAGMGGAALEAGDTFKGAMDNAGAALGRLGASLLSGVFPMIAPALQGIIGWLDTLAPYAETAGKALGDWLGRAGETVQAVFGWIRDNAVPVVQDFIAGIRGGEGPAGQLRDVLDGIGSVVRQAFDYIRDTAIPAFMGFIAGFREGEGAGGALRGTLEQLRGAWQTMIGVVRDTVIPVLRDVWSIVQEYVLPVLGAIVDFVVTRLWPDVVDAFVNRIMPAFVEAGRVISAFWEAVARPALEALWKFIRDILLPFILDFYENGIKPTFDLIGKAISGAWNNVIKPTFTALKDGGDALKEKFFTTRDNISDAWEAISGAVSTAWDAVERIFDKFKSGLGDLRDRFRSIKDGIVAIWGSIARALGSPINSAIGFFNKFLAGLESTINKIPGVDISLPRISEIPLPAAPRGPSQGGGGGDQFLAAGGRVAGYSPTPTADNIPAMLTAGEYVLPVGAVRSLSARFGGGFLEELRRGLPGYARGGPVGGNIVDLAGGAVKKVANWVTDLISDPVGKIKELGASLLDGMADSLPGRILRGVAGEALDALGKHLLSLIGVGDAGPIPATGWSGERIASLARSLDPSVRVTSTYRQGAVTSTGVPSLHGMNRAADLVSSNMGRLWELLRANGPAWTELFYTPKGFIRRGAMAPSSSVAAITKSQHYDHVHAAYGQGGLVKPLLFDSGGVLPPGTSLVSNQTGEPEPLVRLGADGEVRLTQADMDYLAGRIGDRFESGLTTAARVERRVGRTFEAGRRRV